MEEKEEGEKRKNGLSGEKEERKCAGSINNSVNTPLRFSVVGLGQAKRGVPMGLGAITGERIGGLLTACLRSGYANQT